MKRKLYCSWKSNARIFCTQLADIVNEYDMPYCEKHYRTVLANREWLFNSLDNGHMRLPSDYVKVGVKDA